MNPMRSMLLWASQSKGLERSVSGGGAFARAARRFVAGEKREEALAVIKSLNEQGIAANLDLLGENTTNEEEARAAAEEYVRLAQAIREAGLDASVSIKLTQLGMDLGMDTVIGNTTMVIEAATAQGVGVEIDMEASEYVDRTLDVYQAVQERFGTVGIAVQAYLKRTVADVERLVELGAKVRVVKGAYKEPKDIAYQSFKQIREAFIEVLDVLMTPQAAAKGVCAAIGSHDDLIVDYAAAKVEENKLPPRNYEYQFLYGIRRDLHERFASQGQPVRIYVPFGTCWYPYSMRRLAERPANLKFFIRALVGK